MVNIAKKEIQRAKSFQVYKPVIIVESYWNYKIHDSIFNPYKNLKRKYLRK